MEIDWNWILYHDNDIGNENFHVTALKTEVI